MRSCTAMRRAGPAWFALTIAGAAGMANAAPDPRPVPSATGGWTHDGWSDSVAATASPSVAITPVRTGAETDSRGPGTTPETGARPADPRPMALPARDTPSSPATSAPTLPDGIGVRPATAQSAAPVPVANPTGGWTREGWRDDVATTGAPSITAPAGAARSVQGVIPPPAPRRPGVDAAGRRLPWDGGRGPAFRYERGQRLPTLFVEQPYRVDDWIGYGLPIPPTGARWVRYFDDAVMIDESALVFDAAPGIDWTTPPAIYGPTPRIIDNATGRALPARADGSITTTEIRSTPGGGRVMVTTTTTPEVATTVIEEHEVP